MHFVERKCMNLDNNFAEVSSQSSNYQYSTMGSDDGLAPTRRQANIWINDGYITEAYMRLSTSINELKCRKHHVQQHVL